MYKFKFVIGEDCAVKDGVLGADVADDNLYKHIESGKMYGFCPLECTLNCMMLLKKVPDKEV